MRQTVDMYVVLYLPRGAEPEVFGPYSTYQLALNILRSIAGAAGYQLGAPASGLRASINLMIEGEHHRYQLLKVGSSDQLQVHASLIKELAETSGIEAVSEDDLSPPGSLSGY